MSIRRERLAAELRFEMSIADAAELRLEMSIANAAEIRTKLHRNCQLIFQ
jgi:hypothetical protein